MGSLHAHAMTNRRGQMQATKDAARACLQSARRSRPAPARWHPGCATKGGPHGKKTHLWRHPTAAHSRPPPPRPKHQPLPSPLPLPIPTSSPLPKSPTSAHALFPSVPAHSLPHTRPYQPHGLEAVLAVPLPEGVEHCSSRSCVCLVHQQVVVLKGHNLSRGPVHSCDRRWTVVAWGEVEGSGEG